MNDSWPIQDLKWTWLKVKQLKINNGLKYYFKADLSKLLSLLKTPEP